ncbi:Glutamyl-Q tRNA(Asp) synthetase [uncultured Pleomorphomonas sp.]|uniref:Glutamyl-Q tRNA(Asp) synthetase n=1 Tax=uncultured Pleomorphomonas sp. TaxID=442121 RepID=A0A212LKV5_9HYPH|nr:tRNA glutamyl-Q(34) synthetase GluQRS [uncultured Pleomorphomonas sp.]SCM78158.1 Glutamyl-Q tRNA(Asp) synthetase [uncultured Pleomorphomonas sp.]
MTVPVFRFAPSPNGPLHLGHALSALLNADMAAESGGRMLVRIEDVDVTRARPEYERAILDDLDWLGIGYETPVRRQSEHADDYAAALDRLAALGLVYRSFMSRAEIAAAIAAEEARNGRPWPRDPDGAPLYPAADRDRPADEAQALAAAGRPSALRLDMEKAVRLAGTLFWREFGDGLGGPGETVAADAAAWGDVVLAGKFAPAAYHLAVVVDDALQGVTDVVRGRDLYFSTAVHRLLQTLLGLPAPRYHHHRLIVGADGRKLSKSRGSEGLAALRAAGATAADVRRMVGLAVRH